MQIYWISPAILWVVFAVTIPAMAVTRRKSIVCWFSGCIFASAVFTTVVVSVAQF